ncbi:hypothetical protein LCGC14_2301590 [marine sediment metagenome]|uniref:YopX protein domain-containing protein n=1 Tax=marine sediment metagenome TaxID=412755 RepID=A0A0F9CND1_9ZZZZ
MGCDMSREIKFRAWSRKHQTMWHNIHTTYYFLAFLEDEDIEVLEYAGRKDKNGAEIYEGDVLDFHRAFETDKTNEYKFGHGVVKNGEWSCACGDYYCTDHGLGWYVEGNDGYKRRDGRTDTYDFLETIQNCEGWLVIGNIYENPELVK